MYRCAPSLTGMILAMARKQIDGAYVCRVIHGASSPAGKEEGRGLSGLVRCSLIHDLCNLVFFTWASPSAGEISHSSRSFPLPPFHSLSQRGFGQIHRQSLVQNRSSFKREKRGGINSSCPIHLVGKVCYVLLVFFFGLYL